MSVVAAAETLRDATLSSAWLQESVRFPRSHDPKAHDHTSRATVEQGASALLSCVLARIGLVATPIIQIMPCIPGGYASDIALSLAVAAATHLGRTLLIDVAQSVAHETPVGLSASTLRTARDILVPALHHAHLGPFLLGRRNGSDNVQLVLAASAKSFRLLALDCLSAGASPEGLALARLCSGTIVIVQAGRTGIPDVFATLREIESAGGRVLGTVLTQVPQRLPAWMNPEAAA